MIVYFINVITIGARQLRNSLFRDGHGLIVLSNPECSDNFKLLIDCHSPEFGKSQCSHDLDVGVKCQLSSYNYY